MLSDGFTAYRSLKNYNHQPTVVGAMAAHVVLPWVHRVFANFKRWRSARITASAKRTCAATSMSSSFDGTADGT